MVEILESTENPSKGFDYVFSIEIPLKIYGKTS